jgi:hypothetical protein
MSNARICLDCNEQYIPEVAEYLDQKIEMDFCPVCGSSDYKKQTTAFDRFLGYFCFGIIMLFAGYFWCFSQDRGTDVRQFETQIKHELKEGPKVPFRIAGTNIKITPWKDGSGVIRIIE